jgi:hypothetical protein
MNSPTCSVLASIFPLILLTVVLESRNVNLGLRRLKIFRPLVFVAVGTSLIGVFLAVVGVSTNGLEVAWGALVWVAFSSDLLALALLVLMLVVTREFDEDHPKDSPSV